MPPTTPPARYLLDANVFMEAKRRYYRFGFCPGFWDCLLYHEAPGTLRTLDKVADEIRRGKDDLLTWLAHAPASLVEGSGTPAVLSVYAQLQAWAAAHRGANGQPFTRPALADFASAAKADAFLVAFAKVHGYTVVTEEGRGQQLSRVLIPVVCEAFDVPWMNTFDMLERLGGQMAWTP